MRVTRAAKTPSRGILGTTNKPVLPRDLREWGLLGAKAPALGGPPPLQPTAETPAYTALDSAHAAPHMATGAETGRVAIHSWSARQRRVRGRAAPNGAPRYLSTSPALDRPVVRQSKDDGERELVMLRWGLIPSWSKGPDSGYSMINARAETVATKPAFRSAFRFRRCLVPADGFYEWRKLAGRKQPYRITLKDDAPFAFAGLWEHWAGPGGYVIQSFTIIVTEANELLRPIHDRMPVILDPANYTLWLGEEPETGVGVRSCLDHSPPTRWSLTRLANGLAIRRTMMHSALSPHRRPEGPTLPRAPAGVVIVDSGAAPNIKCCQRPGQFAALKIVGIALKSLDTVSRRELEREMAKKRDTVTYALYDKRKKVYVGVTEDPERRVREHELEGKRFSRMDVTSRKMTEDGARQKEAEQLESYRRAHRGRNPRYNK